MNLLESVKDIELNVQADLVRGNETALKVSPGELAPVLMQRPEAACAKALDRVKDSGIILGGESRQTGSVGAVLRRSRPAETLTYRW